jgi:hypothetical protein
MRSGSRLGVLWCYGHGLACGESCDLPSVHGWPPGARANGMLPVARLVPCGSPHSGRRRAQARPPGGGRGCPAIRPGPVARCPVDVDDPLQAGVHQVLLGTVGAHHEQFHAAQVGVPPVAGEGDPAVSLTPALGRPTESSSLSSPALRRSRHRRDPSGPRSHAAGHNAARRRSRSPEHRYLAGLSPVPAASRCTG